VQDKVQQGIEAHGARLAEWVASSTATGSIHVKFIHHAFHAGNSSGGAQHAKQIHILVDTPFQVHDAMRSSDGEVLSIEERVGEQGFLYPLRQRFVTVRFGQSLRTYHDFRQIVCRLLPGVSRVYRSCETEECSEYRRPDGNVRNKVIRNSSTHDCASLRVTGLGPAPVLLRQLPGSPRAWKRATARRQPRAVDPQNLKSKPVEQSNSRQLPQVVGPELPPSIMMALVPSWQSVVRRRPPARMS
jgi:hypothetical protein